MKIFSFELNMISYKKLSISKSLMTILDSDILLFVLFLSLILTFILSCFLKFEILNLYIEYLKLILLNR